MTTTPPAAVRRRHAERALRAAIEACHPRRLLAQRLLPLEAQQQQLGSSLGLIAVGKAAWPMWEAACDTLRRQALPLPQCSLVVSHDQPPDGLADSASSSGSPPRSDLHWFRSEHPLPGVRGEAAAFALEEMAAQRDTRATGATGATREAKDWSGWLVLLSGGASSLLPAPAVGVSLSDKQRTSDLLMRSGADIAALNIVRRHLSRLKGGGLARLLWPAPVLVLVISDVIGDDLATIGSGPCAPDPSTFSDALAVLRASGERYPSSVIERFERGAAGEIRDTLEPGAPELAHVEHRILANHHTASSAAAGCLRTLGYEVVEVKAPLVGSARRAGAAVAAGLARRCHEAADSTPRAFVYSGETTVIVRGGGKGGRCQELALAAGLELERLAVQRGASLRWTVLAAGTDGRDGPTDAAGALLDECRWQRLRRDGIEASVALDDNDSHRALAAADALLPASPTGTNVADLTIVLGTG